MLGSELREIRHRLQMDRLQFARLLGYTGTDRNDVMRVRRLENGRQVPLYLARLVWLVAAWVRRTNAMPPFPEWPGYEFEHTPDALLSQPEDGALS